MTLALFVTGTDTGIGKTRVSSALLRWGRAHGLRTVGLKPLATGSEVTADGLRNEDALTLQSLATVALPYGTVNPFCFLEPMAPHLAAGRVGVRLSVEALHGRIRAVEPCCDLLVVEGVGGLSVPLNEKEDLSDLARALGYPVLLVVGVRLGCLNHARLAAAALERLTLPWAWVANRIDPDCLDAEGNRETLRDRLGAPLLWEQPYGMEGDDDARLLGQTDLGSWLRRGGR